MRICVNSRNVTPKQKAKIEGYFDDHFSFDEKRPSLIWQDDASDCILLAYPHPRGLSAGEAGVLSANSVMHRVHENQLLQLVGRDYCKVFPD